ncbi:MAG: HAD hydrolase family protein, partial [Candidatus Thioglobus sp.]|nr:HAD hydrolase family protein [Candidatus Thioglobus sp.]
NRLTGKLIGDIINAKSKADFVLELCRENSLLPNQVMVAGDGANDLEMMKVAGLSVAFRAKPAVRKAANIIIDFGGLDKIMDFFHSNYAA